MLDKHLTALRGLSCGPAYLSASECGDKSLMSIVAMGYAEMWTMGAGFIAWRITDAGREALKESER